MKTFTIFLVLLFALSAFGQRRVTDWYQLKSVSDGFSAKFPARPTVETQKSSTVTQNSYKLTLKDSSAFVVIHAAMPKGLGSTAEMLKTTQYIFQSYLSSLKGNIGAYITIQASGCVGKEVKITKGQSIIYARLFVSGENLYMLIYGTNIQSQHTPQIRDYFFNSFVVTGGCTDVISPFQAPSNEIKSQNISGLYDQISKWNKVITPSDGLEFLIPYTAIKTEQEVSIEPYRLTRRIYTSSSQSETYFISVLGDLPNEPSQPQYYTTALKLLVNNFKTELNDIDPNTQLTFIRNLQIGKYPGQEYKVLIKDRIGRLQCFVTTQRAYIFTYSDAADNYSAEKANKFFNSIKISIR